MSAKKPQGRVPFLEGCKAVKVYMDNKSLEKAKKIGVGNVSAGVRLALSEYKK